MPETYIYNGKIVKREDIEHAAKESGMDLDSYLGEVGIKTVPDNYDYNGKKYTAQDVLEGATASGVDFDTYLSKSGIKPIGGEENKSVEPIILNPTPKGVGQNIGGKFEVGQGDAELKAGSVVESPQIEPERTASSALKGAGSETSVDKSAEYRTESLDAVKGKIEKKVKEPITQVGDIFLTQTEVGQTQSLNEELAQTEAEIERMQLIGNDPIGKSTNPVLYENEMVRLEKKRQELSAKANKIDTKAKFRDPEHFIGYYDTETLQPVAIPRNKEAVTKMVEDFYQEYRATRKDYVSGQPSTEFQAETFEELDPSAQRVVRTAFANKYIPKEDAQEYLDNNNLDFDLEEVPHAGNKFLKGMINSTASILSGADASKLPTADAMNSLYVKFRNGMITQSEYERGYSELQQSVLDKVKDGVFVSPSKLPGIEPNEVRKYKNSAGETRFDEYVYSEDKIQDWLSRMPTGEEVLNGKESPYTYEKGSLGQASDALQEYANKLKSNPALNDSFFLSKVPEGLGSSAPFLATAVVSGLAGAPSWLAPALAGGLANASSAYDDAIANGATGDEAVKAYMLGFGIGTSEAIPLERLMNRFGGGIGFQKKLIESFKQGTEEAIQEAFTGISNDVIAKVIYDESRRIGQDADSNAGVGFATGIIMAGGKVLSARKDVTPEQQKMVEKAQENLRVWMEAEASDESVAQNVQENAQPIPEAKEGQEAVVEEEVVAEPVVEEAEVIVPEEEVPVAEEQIVVEPEQVEEVVAEEVAEPEAEKPVIEEAPVEEPTEEEGEKKELFKLKDDIKVIKDEITDEVVEEKKIQQFDYENGKGGRAFGTIEDGVVKITQLQAQPGGKPIVKGTGMVEGLVEKLKSEGFKTIQVNLQNENSKGALESLVKKGKLENPRNKIGSSGNEYNTTFDIVQDKSNTPQTKPLTPFQQKVADKKAKIADLKQRAAEAEKPAEMPKMSITKQADAPKILKSKEFIKAIGPIAREKDKQGRSIKYVDMVVDKNGNIQHIGKDIPPAIQAKVESGEFTKETNKVVLNKTSLDPEKIIRESQYKDRVRPKNAIEKQREVVERYKPVDLDDAIGHYFAKGGRVRAEDFEHLTGFKKGSKEYNDAKWAFDHRATKYDFLGEQEFPDYFNEDGKNENSLDIAEKVMKELASGQSALSRAQEYSLKQEEAEFAAEHEGRNRDQQEKYEKEQAEFEAQIVEEVELPEVQEEAEQVVEELEKELTEEELAALEDYLNDFIKDDGTFDYAAAEADMEAFDFGSKAMDLPLNIVENFKKLINEHQDKRNSKKAVGEGDRQEADQREKQREIGENIAELESEVARLKQEAKAQENKLQKLRTNLNKNLKDNQVDIFNKVQEKGLFDDKADQQKEFDAQEAILKDLNDQLKSAEEKLQFENDRVGQAEMFEDGETFKINGQDTFYHASGKKRDGRLKESTAPQFGTGVYFSTNKNTVVSEFGKEVTEVKLALKNPLHTNTKAWNEVKQLAIKLADDAHGKKNGLTEYPEDQDYFKYDKEDSNNYYEIEPHFISDAAKQMGYDAIVDGNSTYENEIIVLDESKIIYPEDQIEVPKTYAEKRATHLAKIKELKAKGKNLGIQDDINKIRAEIMAEYTDLAIDAIKEGIKTVAEFAKELGEEVTEVIKEAWERAKNEIEEEENKGPLPIGVTNAHTNAMLRAAGKDPVAKEARKVNQELWDRVMAKIGNGLIDARLEVAKIANTEQPSITDEQQAIILFDRIRITNEMETLERQLDQQIKDGNTEQVANTAMRIAEMEIELELNAMANTKAGREWGRMGQFRQRMAARDFSLVAMIEKANNLAMGGKLSARDREIFEELAAKYKELQKQHAEIVSKLAEKEVEFENRIKAERKKAEKVLIDKVKKDLQADAPKKNTARIGTAIRKFAEKVESGQINKLGGYRSSSIFDLAWDASLKVIATALRGGAKLADAIEAGLDEIKKSDWYKNLTEDKDKFENDYREHLQKEYEGEAKAEPEEINEEFQQMIDELAIQYDVFGSLELEEGMRTIFNKMLYNRVENGMETIDEVVNSIFDAVQEFFPDITKTDLRDFISGYGKFTKLSKEEIDVQVREIKRQGRLDAALDAVTAGELPLRSGVEKEKPSQDTRQKQAEILRIIKEKGIEEKLSDAEKENAWVTAQEAYHRRLENAIDDIQREIDTRQRRTKGEKKKFDDPKSKQLQADLDRLKTIRDAIFKTPPKSKEQIATEQAIKAAGRRITELQRRIAENDLTPPKKGTKVVETPELKRLRDQVKNLNDYIDGLKKQLNPPKTKQQIATDAAIKATEKVIAQIELGIRNLKDGKTEDGEVFPEKKAPSKPLTDARLKQLRDLKERLAEERKALLPEAVVRRAALEKYKKSRERKLKTLEQKLKDKDFEPKKKPETPAPDAELIEINKKIQAVERQVQLEMERIKLANRSKWRKFYDLALEIFNLPKALIASVDLSAPLRQGLFLIGKPGSFTKALGEMFAQAFSQKKADEWLANFQQQDIYQDIKKVYKLYIAEPTAHLSAKEESFMSNLLKIFHKIPVWGQLLKMSERAYAGFLNKLRVDVFMNFRNELIRKGYSGEELQKELIGYAKFINNATGRGGLGFAEPVAPLLNAIFFSPKLIMSRLNTLPVTPIGISFYYRLPKEARKDAILSLLKFAGIGVSTLVLAQLAWGGDDDDDKVEIETDPRSSDFGKMRFGDLRYDIWGGYQQPFRTVAQVTNNLRFDGGKKKSITTGEITELNRGFAGSGDNEADVITKFFLYKFSPSASLAYGLFLNDGKSVMGDEIELQSEVINKLVPLYLQDMKEIYEEEGLGVTVSAAVPALFGVGVQYYGDK